MNNLIAEKFRPYRKFACWSTFEENETELVRIFSISGVFKLNKLGSVVWQFIDGNTTINEIVSKTWKLFPESDKTKIEDDIMFFLNDLIKHDLLILDWDPLQPYLLTNSKYRC